MKIISPLLQNHIATLKSQIAVQKSKIDSFDEVQSYLNQVLREKATLEAERETKDKIIDDLQEKLSDQKVCTVVPRELKFP